MRDGLEESETNIGYRRLCAHLRTGSFLTRREDVRKIFFDLNLDSELPVTSYTSQPVQNLKNNIRSLSSNSRINCFKYSKFIFFQQHFVVQY